MSNTFWLNNPSILVDKNHVTEIFPSNNLNYESKINAITRMIIILSILGYFLTKSVKILLSAAMTIIIIAIIYKTQKKKRVKNNINKQLLKEGFTNAANYEKHKSNFTEPTKQNPLMNVLLPEINDNPDRKPAAPSFNRNVERKINEKTIGPDSRLFLDLGDSISFEQSMRNFYSTPNTKVCNDQTSFAKFCYGDMPSCKEGNELQCTKNNQRYTLF
uniref:Minor capsid protein P9 transmembrane helices domain-containing protein n=1 Tax=viral metagenome TaxID=1070528 RepID=A0A6C0C6M9_9ZZZZ